ncbi:hypothetical protein [Nostoc sp.]|uniref:hypothetical protein n=1 Tax=Nostoc sp. TaxID=1180 RepID=UPI002FF76603
MSINKNETLTIETQEELFEVLSDECCEQLTGGGFWKKFKKTFDHVVIKTLNNTGNDVVKVGGTSALGLYTLGELALEETGMVGSGQIDGN